MKNTVKVVIPLYRAELEPMEIVSLEQCLNVLGSYPLVIVKPHSLCIDHILQRYNHKFEVENFDDSFFVGIAGYNRLMLSSLFYERFLNSEYILIYQLDAFVFRDELAAWCERKYDYIGAPWLCKRKYKGFLLKSFLKIRGTFYEMADIKHRQQCFYKVGNGGFSLRKVETFYKKTLEKKEIIDYYLSNLEKGSQYNEDVFWALEAPRGSDFIIPNWKKALYFSFDLFPDIAYQFTHGKLPFGCHKWNKESGFWKEIIAKHIASGFIENK